MIREATEILRKGSDLAGSMMQAVMEEIMTGGAQTPDIVSFLTGLSEKGESIDEVAAAASVMRKHVTAIHTEKTPLLDTCGTGGDKKGIFNVSTVVALVAAGCGIAVAKHGNRSVTSCCGSADILEALGVDINMDKDKLQRCLSDIGIAFLFAPNLHPAMKYAMPARKQISEKTIFNILGPLTNPAGATHQLVGVYSRRWTTILAGVLERLGTQHALIVHSEDGLDEISTTAKTYISESHKGGIKSYEVSVEEFGISRAKPDDLKGGSIPDNVKIISDILKGGRGPRRDIVLLNAAAAIYAADKAPSIKEGVALAAESVDSGSALKKLKQLQEYSKRG